MGNPKLSKRAVRSPYSPVRKLFTYARDARRRGVEVLNLNIGEPDLPTPRFFFREMRNFSPKTVSYAPSAGFEASLNAWIRFYRRYGIALSANDLVMTSGGSEAILFAFTAVADPGDEIIVFEPLYPNFTTIARMLGIRLVPVTLEARTNFRLPSVRTIASRITSRTRAILVCDPSNPTGTVLSGRERATIAEVARRRNLFIITDETYREIVFGTKPHSFMQNPAVRDRTILVDSASKRFNVCGARVGVIASHNRSVIDSALKFAQARLSTPSIEQLAVVPLLDSDRSLTRDFVAAYRERVRAAANALRKIPGVSFTNPSGAFYLMATLPVDNTEHFCRWLLTDFSYKGATVLLAPGSGFYVTPGRGQNEVRIACVVSPSRIRRAITVLAHALAAYPGS